MCFSVWQNSRILLLVLMVPNWSSNIVFWWEMDVRNPTPPPHIVSHFHSCCPSLPSLRIIWDGGGGQSLLFLLLLSLSPLTLSRERKEKERKKDFPFFSLSSLRTTGGESRAGPRDISGFMRKVLVSFAVCGVYFAGKREKKVVLGGGRILMFFPCLSGVLKVKLHFKSERECVCVNFKTSWTRFFSIYSLLGNTYTGKPEAAKVAPFGEKRGFVVVLALSGSESESGGVWHWQRDVIYGIGASEEWLS